MSSMIFKQKLLKELWQVRNPHRKKPEPNELKELESIVFTQAKKEKPTVFPKNPLPSKKAFFELTSSRNKFLINPQEQLKLRHTCVGFFGLSVGSHAALTWMTESRALHIKISDPDNIDASNLNRLRMGWDDIGQQKTEVVAKSLYQINPFTKVIKTNKTDFTTIKSLFSSAPSLDVVSEAIDDMEGKIWIRQLCRQYHLPLISAADVGDNIMLDIERYDLNANYPFFHGRVKDIEKINFKSLTSKQKKRLIIKLVGFDHNSEKMIESLFAIEGATVTWPQLGATATIAGGISATTIKKIVLGESIHSGRYFFPLDDILDSSFNLLSRRKYRNQLTSGIIKEIEKD